jgi:ABC-type antimicrobial peptide transport system permease subunit
VCSSALFSISVGIVIGALLSGGLGRLAVHWFAGVAANARIVVLGATVLGLAGLLACAAPVARACRVDPAGALRCD